MAALADVSRFLLIATEGPEFWVPMTFILVGLALFLWEISMPGFFVAIPATVAIVLGVIGLFVEGFLTNPVWVLLVGLLVGAPTTMVVMRLYRNLAPPDAPPTTTTGESLRGKQGTVTVEVLPETTKGKVRVEGVIWSARTEGDPIPVGTRVEIVRSQGVHIVVKPADLGAAVAAHEAEQSGDAFSPHRHSES